MELRRALTIMGTLLGGAVAIALLSGCDRPPTRFIVVTTFVDGRDAAPGNGICEVTPGHGDCSLRAAIDEANLTTGPVDITAPPGTYVLVSGTVSDDDVNAVGDLDLFSPSPQVNLHSTGNGAHLVEESTPYELTHDAIIDVHSGSVGMVNISGEGGAVGLNVRSSASVTALGGGWANASAAGVSVASGGSYRSSYQLLRANATGVSSSGTLVLDHALVTVNSTGMFLAAGSATVTDSTIVNNFGLSSSPGGIVTGGPAPVYEVDLRIVRTTITHNLAGVGGGVSFAFGHLSVEDSTIVDNSNATSTTGAGVLIGATTNYLGLPWPTATITRSTITENAPTGPPELALFAAHGSISVTGSIIQASGYDCAGAVSSAGFNLFTDASCAFAAAGDHLVADPLLGPLTANGGTTSTRLPASGSPAVDAIPFGTFGLCDATTPRDQRGVARPQGIACDIGAVERDGP